MSVQPTVLWDFNSLSSRLGIHYLGDLASPFGLVPISGIGLSGYFYPFGITSAIESSDNGTIFKKHKTGPFVMGAFTPVNFNYNEDDGPSFSALLYELMLGAGIDYPLRPNSILSLSFNYRFAAVASNNSDERVEYSGLGIMLSYTATYF